VDFVRGCCSKSSDEEEDDEEAPQEPVKAKRGRPVERKDAEGEKDRARKTANLARRREDRKSVGRPASVRVSSEDSGYRGSARENDRRHELKVETEIVQNVSNAKMGDKVGQSAYLAAFALKRGKEKLEGPLTTGRLTEEEIKTVAKQHENTKKRLRI